MNVAELIELLKGQPPGRRVVLRVSPAECCRTRFHLAIDCMKALFCSEVRRPFVLVQK
jgi:hypothetical protein